MHVRPTTKAWIFYALMLVVIAIIIRRDLTSVLPAQLAVQVGNNLGEGVAAGVLMAATIQWVRPRVAMTRYPMLIITAYAIVLMAFGVYLLYSGLPGRFATYHEPFLAAGVLAVYFQVPRPFPKGLLLVPVTLAIIIVGFDTEFVFKQSESLVLIMLAPVAFDVVDRNIVNREAEDRPRLRLLWCVTLAATWLFFWQVATAIRPDLSGPIDYGIDYGFRAAEAYWGLLVVHGYFSYWLGRDWRSDRSVDRSVALT